MKCLKSFDLELISSYWWEDTGPERRGGKEDDPRDRQTLLWLRALGGKFVSLNLSFLPSKTSKQTDKSVSKNSSQIIWNWSKPRGLSSFGPGRKVPWTSEVFSFTLWFSSRRGRDPCPLPCQSSPRSGMSQLSEATSLQNAGYSRMHSTARAGNSVQNA